MLETRKREVFCSFVRFSVCHKLVATELEHKYMYVSVCRRDKRYTLDSHSRFSHVCTRLNVEYMRRNWENWVYRMWHTQSINTKQHIHTAGAGATPNVCTNESNTQQNICNMPNIQPTTVGEKKLEYFVCYLFTLLCPVFISFLVYVLNRKTFNVFFLYIFLGKKENIALFTFC